MNTLQLKVSEFISEISEGRYPGDEYLDFFKKVVEGKINPSLYATPIISILDQLSLWNFMVNPDAGKIYNTILVKVSERVRSIDVDFFMRYLLTMERIKRARLDHFQSVFMFMDLSKDHAKMDDAIFEGDLLTLYLETLLKIYNDAEDPRRQNPSFEDEKLLGLMKEVSFELKAVNAFKESIDGEKARKIIEFA